MTLDQYDRKTLRKQRKSDRPDSSPAHKIVKEGKEHRASSQLTRSSSSSKLVDDLGALRLPSSLETRKAGSTNAYTAPRTAPSSSKSKGDVVPPTPKGPKSFENRRPAK
jgi:hypothetical protein